MAGIVPIKCDTIEDTAFLVDGYGANALEVVGEMVVVLLADIFDAKIVNYEAEIYWPILWHHRTGVFLARLVSVLANVLDELVMCKASLLWQSVHTSAALCHDVPIFDFFGKAICVDDVLGE